MSTVIELSDAMAKSLDERSREEQVSSEEVIRRALESYLVMRLPSFEPKPVREPGPWTELGNVLGAWRHPDGEEAVESPRLPLSTRRLCKRCVHGRSLMRCLELGKIEVRIHSRISREFEANDVSG